MGQIRLVPRAVFINFPPKSDGEGYGILKAGESWIPFTIPAETGGYSHFLQAIVRGYGRVNNPRQLASALRRYGCPLGEVVDRDGFRRVVKWLLQHFHPPYRGKNAAALRVLASQLKDDNPDHNRVCRILVDSIAK